jgi:hypothetical protein
MYPRPLPWSAPVASAPRPASHSDTEARLDMRKEWLSHGCFRPRRTHEPQDEDVVGIRASAGRHVHARLPDVPAMPLRMRRVTNDLSRHVRTEEPGEGPTVRVPLRSSGPRARPRRRALVGEGYPGREGPAAARVAPRSARDVGEGGDAAPDARQHREGLCEQLAQTAGAARGRPEDPAAGADPPRSRNGPRPVGDRAGYPCVSGPLAVIGMTGMPMTALGHEG